MSAKMMFKELGYSWQEDEYSIKYTKVLNKRWIFKDEIQIIFYKYSGTINIFSSTPGNIRIELNLYDAMDKQLKELGWKE